MSPVDGCYIHGLYIEGARWNYDVMKMDEQEAKILYTDMCNIYFIPMTFDQLDENVDIVIIN